MLDAAVHQMLINRLGDGPSFDRLVEANGDVGVLRPWAEVDKDGNRTNRSFMTIRKGVTTNAEGKRVITYRNVPVTNAPAILTRQDWLTIDRRVNYAAKLVLRFWPLLRSKVPFDLPNGMGTIALQHSIAKTDADAELSMDPIRRAERSRTVFDIVVIPVPVHHGDGSFSARQIIVARNSGAPLDTTAIETTTRKIAENIENLALGLLGTYKFAGGTIYGATNLPQRFTSTFTLPTTGGWVPATLTNELLGALQTLRNAKYPGPYAVLISTNLNRYFDQDYAPTYAGETLRTRLTKINNLTAVETLDYLPNNTILLIQLTPDVVDAVEGLPFTTVQWDEAGGMEKMFKVMNISIPRFKYDANGATGVMHLTGV